MDKQEARALRDEIKAYGLHCTIPRGHTLPRIITDRGPIHFASRGEWEDYRRQREERARLAAEAERRSSRPRSPIDIMIDRACGLE